MPEIELMVLPSRDFRVPFNFTLLISVASVLFLMLSPCGSSQSLVSLAAAPHAHLTRTT